MGTEETWSTDAGSHTTGTSWPHPLPTIKEAILLLMLRHILVQNHERINKILLQEPMKLIWSPPLSHCVY